MTRYSRMSTSSCSASLRAAVVGPDVEADDDGVGGGGQVDVGLGDAARPPPWMTFTRTSSVLSFSSDCAQRLHRALHVGLDDDGQLLDLALLDSAEQLVQAGRAWPAALRSSPAPGGAAAISRAVRSSATTSRTSPACGHVGEAQHLHGRGRPRLLHRLARARRSWPAPGPRWRRPRWRRPPAACRSGPGRWRRGPGPCPAPPR